jgi:hypothetical protein
MDEIQLGRVYRHFKGNYYYLKEFAIDSESGDEYVVYQALYGEHKTYIRLKSKFIDKIDVNRADNVTKQEYRYVLLELIDERR